MYFVSLIIILAIGGITVGAKFFILCAAMLAIGFGAIEFMIQISLGKNRSAAWTIMSFLCVSGSLMALTSARWMPSGIVF